MSSGEIIKLWIASAKVKWKQFTYVYSFLSEATVAVTISSQNINRSLLIEIINFSRILNQLNYIFTTVLIQI